MKNYSKNLRKEPGIGSTPEGLELYAALLRWFTTVTNITPKKVHNMGLKVINILK